MSVERVIPEGVEKYSQSPIFTKDTVPDALLKDHSTKDAVFGRLTVAAGTVRYFLAGEKHPTATIKPGQSWIILPAEVHFIEVSDDAEFQVEFLR